jgi:hypothetical protein
LKMLTTDEPGNGARNESWLVQDVVGLVIVRAEMFTGPSEVGVAWGERYGRLVGGLGWRRRRLL